jgi:protein-tyrosine phosphatase
LDGNELTDIERPDRDDGNEGIPGLADIHTHVIPSVDDGAPDLDSALATLQGLFDSGVTTVVGTPHLNASNPEGKRRTRADQMWPELVRATADRLPELRMHRGYEIQLDTPDLDLSDPDLRLAGSRFALVEFLAFTVPTRSAEVLGRISQSALAVERGQSIG